MQNSFNYFGGHSISTLLWIAAVAKKSKASFVMTKIKEPNQETTS
jgi:hypothetical protein